MLQEIINYTRHLKENSPQIFEQNIEPSKGLHIFIELDEEGNTINFPGEKGVNWDYYDGKEMSPFLNEIIKLEQEGIRIGTRMDKVLDTAKVENSKKFQIFSCSPFVLNFKKQSYKLIASRLNSFFDNAINTCIGYNDNAEILKQKILAFKNAVRERLKQLDIYTKNKSNADDIIENHSFFDEMKDDFFISFYCKNVDFSEYRLAHLTYLKQNLFNKNNYNSDKEITDTTYGLSSFFNGLNSKKIFLEHKTSSLYKGIAGRIQAKDTVFLNDFSLLLRRKVFPQPLPIFIDKNEFTNSDEILKIFKEDGSLTYSQILKIIFKSNKNIVLQNYYLFFFNYKNELEDFDFVSKFQYSLKENDSYPEIINLFEIKENKELKQNRLIKNIFQFEADIVKTIFNNALVKINTDKNEYRVNYFGEMKPEYVSGGEPVFQIILKYRKAFYDYIYKSKTQALNCYMWDEIMWNSILGDLQNTNFDKKYYIEQGIKEKLNIWFSLYNYFTNNKNRIDMASKIPELLEKMKVVANSDNEHFETTEEFAFGAGQVIYYLLNQSKATERTHALLEPFIQKVKAEQLQNSIAQAINMYKHELSFGQGRFERLSREVLAFDTNDNLKDKQRFLLAGYFATPAIYEKKQ